MSDHASVSLDNVRTFRAWIESARCGDTICEDMLRGFVHRAALAMPRADLLEVCETILSRRSDQLSREAEMN